MNEGILITQVLEKNNRAYVFMMPYGALFEDIYDVLKQFDHENRLKQQAAIEAENKKKEESDSDTTL